MSALANVKITHQRGRGWKKMIGGQLFWLGHDEALAREYALMLMGQWAYKKRRGEKWTPEEVEAFYELKAGRLDPGPDMVARLGYNPYGARHPGGHTVFHAVQKVVVGKKPQQDAPAARGGLTVGQALKLFAEHVRTDPQKSAGHISTMESKLRTLRESLPLKTPLADIGHDELTAVVRHWLARPRSQATGRKISAVTAKAMVATARMLFYWLADTGKWQAPGRLTNIFAVDVRKIMSPSERKKAAGGVDVFSVDDLAKLWANANEQGRLYIALGLNCGFAQAEIATLTDWEVKLAETPPRIERHRRKTEVFGSWPLWDETADLLARRMAMTPDNEEHLALLTRNGQPLVHFTAKKGRSDSIAMAWAKLLKKTPEAAQLPFKYLRKTGADMVRRIAGKEISEVHLAHSDGSVYTNADFEKLADAVMKAREQLAPIFEG